MNIFEHAMKMEEDGRNYYLEQAKVAKTPALRRILEELADDELKHYNLFKAMYDNQLKDNTEASGTAIIATTRNIFDDLKAQADSEALPVMGPVSVWEHARDVEKEAEAFYRKYAAETDDEHQKLIFNQIADEEYRHYVALDSVIQFLKKPVEWLENAEWNRLTD